MRNIQVCRCFVCLGHHVSSIQRDNRLNADCASWVRTAARSPLAHPSSTWRASAVPILSRVSTAVRYERSRRGK